MERVSDAFSIQPFSRRPRSIAGSKSVKRHILSHAGFLDLFWQECPDAPISRVTMQRRMKRAKREEATMQYLLMLYSEEGAWNNLPEAVQQEGLQQYMAYGEALRKAGAYLGSNRLRDSVDATRVSVANGKTKVQDGPYADTKEQLGGYYLIEAKNLDEALSWAARCPGAAHGIVEVRPVWQM